VAFARDFGIQVHVVGNKVDDDSDVAFLRDHVGDDLLTWVGRSAFVKAAERGALRPIDELEPANRAALDEIRSRTDLVKKDWVTYTRLAHEFHLRNASAWASERAGEDLAGQIDPEFVLGPDALVH
jgi:CO dehydrogenase maturation factor